MAYSRNRVELMGNLGRDPEIRSTNTGTKVATLSVATTERWKDKDGKPKERTEWHRVNVWVPGLISAIEKHYKKGARVEIVGSLRTQKWTDSASVDRYTTEIVVDGYRGECSLVDFASKAADEAHAAATPPATEAFPAGDVLVHEEAL
jgi:single-strand DNA-binding protein